MCLRGGQVVLHGAVQVARRGSGYPSGDRRRLPWGRAPAGGAAWLRACSLGLSSSPVVTRQSSTPSALLGAGLRSTHPFPAVQVPPAPPSSPSVCRPAGNDDTGAVGGAGPGGAGRAKAGQVSREAELRSRGRPGLWVERYLSVDAGGRPSAAPSAVQRFPNTRLLRLKRTLSPARVPCLRCKPYSRLPLSPFSLRVPLWATDSCLLSPFPYETLRYGDTEVSIGRVKHGFNLKNPRLEPWPVSLSG